MSGSRTACELIIDEFEMGITEQEQMLIMLAKELSKEGKDFHKSQIEQAKRKGWSAWED